MDGGAKPKSYKQYLEIKIACRRNGRVDRPGLEPGRRQRNVARARKRGVFRLQAGQCVCELKINKLFDGTSHRLCTFSTSIRKIREIKYYFNI